jgi:hypothetical protein
MATNLISVVMQFLTPDMVGRIATALGVDRNRVQSAITSAVPGLLAAFNNVATQPGGAQRLADAARQQTGSPGNFASMLASGGQSSFQASQVLASLVGDQNQNVLTQAISKFTGLGQGTTGSLLGMLAPLIMGIIGKHQSAAGGLDPKGIANLFASQKDNIAAALPSGLGSLLSGSGMLNSLGSAARVATATSSESIREASATPLVDAARQRVGTASASSNWLYWILPLGAAAALLIYFAARPTEQVAQQGMTQAQTVTVEGLDIGKQITNSIASLRTTLDGVSDVPSAQAALSKMQAVTAQIDKAGGQVAQLSADQRKVLAGLVNPMMPAFNQLCDKVLAIPGVAAVLKPSVDALKAKLTTLVA